MPLVLIGKWFITGVMMSAFLQSTVGSKFIVAMTGLVMAGFIFVHMMGNLLIIAGADAYNKYAHAITSNLPLLYLTEIVLIVSFFTHVGFAIRLFVKDKAARQSRYYKLPSQKGTTYAARSMILSGAVIFAFLVLHLISFKFGTHYETVIQGQSIRDLYRLVWEKFHEPLFVSWYVIALLILGAHVTHALKGAYQSLGVGSAMNPRVRCFAWGFAVIVAGGFILPPLYLLLFSRGI